MTAPTLLTTCLALAAFAGAAPEPADLYPRLVRSTAWVQAGDNGAGTGFLIDRPRRLLVTNLHVVGGRKRIEVFFPVFRDGGLGVDRAEYLGDRDALHRTGRATWGTVIARREGADLALVELDTVPADCVLLPIAAEVPRPGESVHSVGHRRDLPTLWNYTRGVVRQAGRDGAGYFWRGKELAAAARRVLVSSPINEGDSGGPLVNDRGELVGVLAAVRWQAPGVSVAIDRGEVLALLAAASKEPPGPAPPGKDGEDDLYPRLLAAAAWVRPSATNEHISAWVWDRGRKLLVTTASGAGPDDLVSVVFPLFDGDELIPEEAAYRSGFRLRRAGVWVRGWVLARDPVRDLALIEVEALPERSRTLRLAEQPVPVGGRVHTIGHLSGVDLLWLYGRGAVRQRAGLRLGTGEDDPPLRVTILQLGRRAGAGGGPVVNDRGEVVGMLTGKGAPNQDAEYAVERQEIAAFLKQTKPLWDPSTAADWLRRGDYFLRRGRPGAAAYAYREAVRHEPGSAPARCGLAEAYRRLGRPDEALAECGRAIELAPDSPEGYVRRARVLLDLGRADEAAEDAARAVRIDPKCAEAYAVRGETLLRRGERGAALDDCREALWLAPNLAAAYSLRARLNDTPLGQEQRRLDLDRVLALDPFERAARWQRADDLLRRKEWKKAKADLLRLAESDPADAAPLLRLAAAHLELGETGPALEALGEALWRRPAQAPALLGVLIPMLGERVRR